jgi:hypothetical protein
MEMPLSELLMDAVDLFLVTTIDEDFLQLYMEMKRLNYE